MPKKLQSGQESGSEKIFEEIFQGDYEERKEAIGKMLDTDHAFDILCRQFQMGDKKVTAYAVDGFLQGDVSEKVMEYFCSIKAEDMPEDFEAFLKRKVPYIDILKISDREKFVQMLLAGMTLFLIEGYENVLAIDFRQYPGRSVGEPEADKVLRGSRDGFIEAIVPNVALIRRRIRDVDLKFEMHKVGQSSKSDVVVAYMAGRVKKGAVEEVVKRIKNLSIDSLTMTQESLAEIMFPRKWWNPFPKFKYTERPDTAAACLLEGSIVVMVDNSPAVMILPTSLFSILEDANDYYFPPITGTYLRLTRMLTSVFALFLTPVFILLLQNQQWLPESWGFLLLREEINVPPVVQFLILEFAIDGLKMASVNTPNMLTTPLSIVAGIVFGDYTVGSGIFNAEIMLYMAFVAVANYTQTNMELGYAIKFHRLVLLVLTGLFGLTGFVIGTLFVLVMLIFNPTIVGRGYLHPLLPFDGKQLLRRFFRVSLPYATKK